MLGASFVGCIEDEEKDDSPRNALYAAIDDVNDGNWGKLCKMDVFVLEDNVITLADETELKECTDEFNFENETVPVLFNFTINKYKEVKIDGTLASNSGPIYEVTANLEICVKYDTEPWYCETEEEDISYYTKVSGQWIDITDEWESSTIAPIATFFVEESSGGYYYAEVIKVSMQEDLTGFSFFLKDDTGTTYVGGNGFGEIAMQFTSSGEEHGIQTNYQGDDERLKSRSTNVSNDDGSEFPVHFSDNDRDGKLSSGDKFTIYGQGNSANGPAGDGWKLDIQFDSSGDIIGSAKML